MGQAGEGMEKHVIIGTAGHIDHGKTALVKALTGRDTDRLPEERRRGISIDLGFAPFVLPGGITAGMVDVPGHERFIRNMLAGATGMDLVLLVIAADEGVMPQTREHLDILLLVGIRQGIVVITKIDLVDREWLDLVREEIGEVVRGTFLEEAPVVEVSTVTGQGIEELRRAMVEAVRQIPARAVDYFCRLPVDRVFSSPGFGTVVTGTLASGTIRPEDRLELLPAAREVRVRGVEVHGRKVNLAVAGQRVAANLAGVEREEVERGYVLATPGYLQPGRSLAASLYLLPHAGKPLANLARVHLHSGTAEVTGRMVLLDREELAPGDRGYVRFRAEKPVVLARGDRYIIRSFSPQVTIGGGTILDPLSRHRRFREEDLQDLANRERGTPLEVALAVLQRSRFPVTVEELARKAGFLPGRLAEAAREWAGEGLALFLGDGPHFLFHRRAYEALRREVADYLEGFHRQYPLRRGVPREELRRRLLPRVDTRLFGEMLAHLQEDGVVDLYQDKVSRAGRTPELGPQHDAARDTLEKAYREGRFTPPTPAEALEKLNLPEKDRSDLWQLLVEEGILIKVAEDFYLHREVYREARERVKRYIQEHGALAVSDCRDLLATTRRFAVPLLEHFDEVKFTRRRGDLRVLNERSEGA